MHSLHDVASGAARTTGSHSLPTDDRQIADIERLTDIIHQLRTEAIDPAEDRIRKLQSQDVVDARPIIRKLQRSLDMGQQRLAALVEKDAAHA